MTKGALIFNRYYSDAGLDYTGSRLRGEFADRGIELLCGNFSASFKLNDVPDGLSFALFFDKDVHLARFLENNGIRVINSARTVAVCDDKVSTYSELASLNIAMPKTLCAPLMYDVNDAVDADFLELAASTLGFPVVVKENIGSQGRQVYLARDTASLRVLYERLKHIPHHYQRFTGAEEGCDIRVYIVGREAAAAANRRNTTDFRSNVGMGAVLTRTGLDESLKKLAERIAQRLDLEYGAVDFIKENGEFVFIEANSNAYFKSIEAQGVNIAGGIADYVTGIFKWT